MISPRRSSGLSKVRLTVMVAACFTLLVAAVFRSPPITFMAAVLFSAMLTSPFIGRLVNRMIGVTRTLPDIGTVGDTIRGQVTLHNRSALPAVLVHVQAGEVIEGQRSTSPLVAVGGDEQVIPVLKPHERLVWSQSWRLQRRGCHQLPPAWAGACDPLALFQALEPKTGVHEILVLPRPLRVNRLGFLGSVAAGLQTPQHATAVADAMDFHGVRAWSPGESIRRVHWKSTARTGQLHVVEWEENIASDLTVLLDTSASWIVGNPADNTLESAITLTASIAAHLLESGYNFQLFCWQQPAAESPELQVLHHDAHSATSLRATLQLLARLQPVREEGATLPRLARSAAPLLPRGRSVLLIASSLADVAGARQTILALQQGGASCYALILDAASFREGAFRASDTPPGDTPSGNARSAVEPHGMAPLAAGTRLVRHSDSLTAVLERTF